MPSPDAGQRLGSNLWGCQSSAPKKTRLGDEYFSLGTSSNGEGHVLDRGRLISWGGCIVPFDGAMLPIAGETRLVLLKSSAEGTV